MADGGDDDRPPQGVIVAVRVRPLWVDGRENGCTNVVRMEGNTTILRDPEYPEQEPKRFAFDYAYWSSDAFITDADGILRPNGPASRYADQDQVWNDIGSIVLKNALRGYNCTVFAYGQSGAGKSYSVVGYPPNEGIIPRATREVFRIVNSNREKDVKYEVDIAMIEVYMETIYDLLDPNQKDRQPLKVFITKGEVYIYSPKDKSNRDIIFRACKSAEQAETFRLQGDKNRTVRATGMNLTSSRAHTLFVLRLRKLTRHGYDWSEAFCSKINLVDLAGSERPKDTGLTGIGLEEGKAINASLSALGRAIEQLVKGKQVDYRASKLTEVLAESLNGRAVTCMIAALSPADINYGDTLSTLRFADNAKKMPVRAEKKLSPAQQLIEDLRKENELLKVRLCIGLEDSGQGRDRFLSEEADKESMRQAEEARAAAEKLQSEVTQLRKELAAEEAEETALRGKMASLQEKLAEANDANRVAQQAEEAATCDLQALQERQEAIEHILEEKQRCFEMRLKESEQLEAQIKSALDDSCITVEEMLDVFGHGEDLKSLPYLVNLVPDPSAQLVVVLKQDMPVTKYSKNSSMGLGLHLTGESILAHHASFCVGGNGGGNADVELEPEGGASVFVNGDKLTKARKLEHGDRVVFGMEHAFLFVAAGGQHMELLQTPSGPVVQDFNYCITEVARREGKAELTMKTILAKLSSERAVKGLENQLAEYEKELTKLRCPDSRPTAGTGCSGDPAGPGTLATPALGSTGESAQEPSHQESGTQRDNGVLEKVEDVQTQLSQTKSALKSLHNRHGDIQDQQASRMEQLSMQVDGGDRDLAAYIEEAQNRQVKESAAMQGQLNSMMNMMQSLQAAVDRLTMEQRMEHRRATMTCSCEVM